MKTEADRHAAPFASRILVGLEAQAITPDILATPVPGHSPGSSHENAWGASFIIGYGLNAPRHPHHWAEAFAPGQPIGGVVNGPAPRRRQRKAGFRPDSPFDSRQLAYQDAVDNYFTSEPAIDLTASSILLLAALSPPS